KYVKNSDIPESDFNSFFITDIERARKDPNETLKAYIEGIDDSERTEVHENKAIFDKFLNPIYLPDGRWPSQIEHKLSLMQQLAVNSITNSKEHISSVNGDRKSTRLNSSHVSISYAVFCLKKKNL